MRDYSAPYLGYLPSLAYLDYDHEMRLLLKCLKYSTLDFTMWPGECPVIVSIETFETAPKYMFKGQV